MKGKVKGVYALERLSGGATSIHRLHPSAKALATLAFVVAVASFGRLAFGRLLPYLLYVAVVAALSETPYPLLLRRFLMAAPFCLFAGVGVMLADGSPSFNLWGVTISNGAVSMMTIALKAFLCVTAVSLLVATTPLSELTASMRRMGVPPTFTTVFEMTYRYIGTLFDEAYSMYVAYGLRGGGGRGIRVGHMGGFVGQLLLRSVDRSERVYAAMRCRGYPLPASPAGARRLGPKDAAYVAATLAAFTALRLIDMGGLIADMIGGA